MKQGILYAIDVPAKKRGPYQIRVAIRDTGTEKIGSASQFLEVPELKKARMALTSIVLWDPSRGLGNRRMVAQHAGQQKKAASSGRISKCCRKSHFRTEAPFVTVVSRSKHAYSAWHAECPKVPRS